MEGPAVKHEKPKPQARSTLRMQFSLYPEDAARLEACRNTLPVGQQTNSEVIRMVLRLWEAEQARPRPRRKGD